MIYLKIYALAVIMTAISATAFAQAQTLTLETFLAAAQKESPDLVVESTNLDSAEARADGVRIDPPMIGFMQMKEGASKQDGYEVSQSIPFPTKMIQDKKVRDLEYETQKESTQYQKAIILNEARNAYLNFWSTYEKLQILKDKHHWLKHHVSITRSSTRADSAAQVHLLEVESDRDLIENEVISAEAEVAEKANALRIYVPTIKIENIIPKEPPLPVVEVTDLKSSFVKLKEKELTVFQAQESLKKQNYLPDLFLRVRSFNGNDMAPQNQEIMVGISLPFLFFWQPKAQVAESAAQRMKAEAELHKAKIEFESKLLTLSKKLEALRLQLSNLKEKLIPRAEKRKRLALNISTRTMEGLNEHKSVEVGLLDLRMKAVDVRIEYENTVKELIKVTGTTAQAGSL